MKWLLGLLRRRMSASSADGRRTPAAILKGPSAAPITNPAEKDLIAAYNNADWDSAIALLKRLIELHPHDERWRRYLSTAHEKNEDKEATRAHAAKYLLPISFESQVRASTKDSPRWVSRSKDARAVKKTERETKLELEDRLRARQADERAQLFRPRALTPFDKFKKVKPTGSRDGYG